MSIIALLTDFGTKDYFVGAMKGAILSINREALVVDLTHEIPAQDVRAAAFTLEACFRDFPEKTIFVAVVDPGVGSARRAVLAASGKYFFLAPDNGLLSFVFDEGADVFELTNEKYFAASVSRTFHGRDVFAPAAACLSGGVEPKEFGRRIDDFVRFDANRPRPVSGGEIEAEIVHVDRFGNLVTNLKKTDLPEKFSLKIVGKNVETMRDFYAEAEPGEIFAIFGSAGYLEISAREDSAAKLLGAENGEKVRVGFTEPKKST